MTIANDPQQTEAWQLPLSKDLTFHIRYLTARVQVQFSSLLQVIRSGDSEDELQALMKAIGMGVVSVDGLPEGKTMDDLPDILAMEELVDLAVGVLTMNTVGYAEKKRSALQSESDTDKPAVVAEAASA